jgi:hypothetical protein
VKLKKTTVIDLTGKRFGRLVVIRRAENIKAGVPRWFCRCDCGQECKIAGEYLRKGDTKSCGCLSIEVNGARFRTHGKTETREHLIWRAMKTRCSNPRQPGWKRYGGRGIKVCDRWADSFELFLEDMGECPKGYTIERINVDGNYEPSNCKWIQRSEQGKNTSRNRILTYKGESKILSEWVKELGVNRKFFDYRLSLGQSAEEVIEQAKLRRRTIENAK